MFTLYIDHVTVQHGDPTNTQTRTHNEHILSIQIVFNLFSYSSYSVGLFLFLAVSLTTLMRREHDSCMDTERSSTVIIAVIIIIIIITSKTVIAKGCLTAPWPLRTVLRSLPSRSTLPICFSMASTQYSRSSL